MKKTVLIFGAIAGITVVIYSYITFLVLDFGSIAKLSPEKLPGKIMWAEMLGYLRYFILIIGVILAMRTMKKETGSSTYGRALGTGVLVTLITALFIGAMEFMYIKMNPDFFENYARISETMMRQAGVAEAEIQKQANQMKEYSFMASPLANFILYFIETTLIGTFASAIGAIFFRK